MAKGFNFNIPKVSSSTEVERPSPIISRWRSARHIKTKKNVSALQLTREQAILACRLMNQPWVGHMDYLVSYRDGSVRAFKTADFEDTYYFPDSDEQDE